MSSAARGARQTSPPELPAEFATVIRPELPRLFREITDQIRRDLPEYAHAQGTPYDRTLRQSVERSLDGFAQRVASPQAKGDAHARVHYRLGRLEALQGRPLDSLQTAYRIGGRVAWHRALEVGAERRIDPQLMVVLADALFAYVDELATHARAGYLEALARNSEEMRSARRRLLRLVVAEAPVAMDAITELARQVHWTVPELFTSIALRPGAAIRAPELDEDVLLDTEAPEPHALFPGPLSAERRAMLTRALGATPAAVGPAVVLHRSAHSLRWARQALRLAEVGVIRSGPLVLCDDHLLTLWLMSDPPLAEQIAARELSPLTALAPSRCERLTETLRVWLTSRGTAAEMAEELTVHPQTVRYRLRAIEQVYGKRINDTRVRFALEAALRCLHLRRHANLRTVRPEPLPYGDV
ncbi:helix-turn-helix domain-containing protein [Streptomyces polyrhachis]|uniref:Helix-turn-helix domain-containing protein n=1 Tax=Streptomyces polyrhachis TaxID=1282885 RepID=A0ABW2GAE0_9ACTN